MKEDEGSIGLFGFRWGPMDVVRMSVLPGDRRVLGVKTSSVDLEVYVSATGRSVRVFRNGIELK